MNIKYIVSTKVFWWREHPLSFEQETDYLKSLGFGIELLATMRGHSECRFTKRNWQRLKLATEGMTVSLCSRSDGPTLDEWHEQVMCAKAIDAVNIVTSLSAFCVSEIPGTADWGYAAEVVKMAREVDIPLCVESGPLQMLKLAGEKFDSIKYCIDTGFANLDPENDFRQYVDQLIERTAHLHLADNYGDMSEHQPPGLPGGISMEKWDYLRQALEKHDGDVIASLEMVPSLPHVMIRQAYEFLFEKANWPDPPARAAGYKEAFYLPF